MLATVAVEALAQLRASVDALLDADLTSADGLELTGLLGELEVQHRRLDAVAVAIDAATDERRVAGEFADATLTDLLAARLTVDGREARARAQRAALLGPRFALSGECLAPILPRAAAALASGQISAEHVEVIARYTRKVDGLDDAGVDAVPAAEELLVDASRVDSPRRVAQLGELLLARLDPDGAEPRDELAHRRRGFSLVDNADGSVSPRGRWTAELAAAWRALLDTLAAPEPADESGEHDSRSAAQRRHDSMLDAAMRLLNGGLGSGGTPTTLLVRVTADQLAEGARSVPGGMLDPNAYTWDGDADVLAAARRQPGRTSFGRPAATLPPPLRPQSCANPRRSPARTDDEPRAESWEDPATPTSAEPTCSTSTSTTPLRDQVLRRLLEPGLGWSVRMRDGVPEWIPPRWLDLDQRPRRNTAHHLPDYDFGAFTMPVRPA